MAFLISFETGRAGARRGLAAALLACLLSQGAFAFPVRFVDANEVSEIPSSAAPSLNPEFGFPVSQLKVFDPYEQQAIEFEGYALSEVLDRVYGARWRRLANTHQLRMSCLDGYRVSVPLSRILKHRALVAVRRIGPGAFSLLKKDITPPTAVDLKPAYLVWENMQDLAIRAEGDYGWPFQWAEAALEKLGEGDPLPLPRRRASAAAARGYTQFKMHCLKCHSIDGIGGKVGPELHYPKSVTLYWRPGLLREWILNPASFRVPNAMPPLAPAHPERARIASEIVSYLSSLPPSKRKP